MADDTLGVTMQQDAELSVGSSIHFADVYWELAVCQGLYLMTRVQKWKDIIFTHGVHSFSCIWLRNSV